MAQQIVYDTLNAVPIISSVNKLARSEDDLFARLQDGESIEFDPTDNQLFGSVRTLAATNNGEIDGNYFQLLPNSPLMNPQAGEQAVQFTDGWLSTVVRHHLDSSGVEEFAGKVISTGLDPREAFGSDQVVLPFSYAPLAISIPTVAQLAISKPGDLERMTLETETYLRTAGANGLEPYVNAFGGAGHFFDGRLTTSGQGITARSLGQFLLCKSYTGIHAKSHTLIPNKRYLEAWEPDNAWASNGLIAKKVVPKIADIIEGYKKDKDRITVLDLGSGGGIVMEGIYNRLGGPNYVTVVGYDINDEAHTHAKQSFDPRQIDKTAHFVTGNLLDIEKLKETLETYRPDVVTMNYLAHDIGPEATENILDLVRDVSLELGLNTKFILSESHQLTIDQLRMKQDQIYFHDVHDKSGQHLCGRDEFYDRIQSRGWRIIDSKEVSRDRKGGNIINEIVVAEPVYNKTTTNGTGKYKPRLAA